MDNESKLEIMLFFDRLKGNMDNLDDPKLPRLSCIEERGYFIAVEKMKYLIDEFKCNKIENEGFIQ